MKQLLFTLLTLSVLALAMFGCGIDARGEKGDSGTPGLIGTPGLVGTPGQNGHSAAIAKTPADVSVCPTGGTVISLGVDTDDDGVLQMGETTQVATLCNGLNGSNGTNGLDGVSPTLSAFTPVGVVSACGGDVNNVNNEVFLRLSNNQLLGSVSDNASGLNTRFGIIAPGTYYSTGHTSCTFVVHADGSITH